MTITDLATYFENFRHEVQEAVPDIIAETAVEYGKEAFNKKAFDKKAWGPAKTAKSTGSLLIDSSGLMNSIEPAVVTPKEVIIQAGNDKVNYAKVHNEGFKGVINIPTHTRKGKEVKAHTRNVDIDARPFLGDAKELTSKIKTRIEGFAKAFWH
jgi:phage gpG-like protein